MRPTLQTHLSLTMHGRTVAGISNSTAVPTDLPFSLCLLQIGTAINITSMYVYDAITELYYVLYIVDDGILLAS